MAQVFLPEKTEQWLLYALRLPGRLNVEQTAQLVGCQPHDIPAIVKAKLLQPLGGGLKNSVKYFASVEVIDKCNDRKWLDRATKAVSRCKTQPKQAQVGDEPVVGRIGIKEGP